jgi:hypothetical protein
MMVASTFLQKDTGLRQPLVLLFSNLLGQIVTFEQAPELQNADLIEDRFIL